MIHLKSHAKINLYLNVLGRREDGYHELQTLFQEISIADELCWQPHSGPFKLVIAGSNVVEPQHNLIFWAADAFEKETKLSIGGSWNLKKRIPVSSGLGGGSSNAAATLRILNAYYHNPLPPERLSEIALNLGADVPFFLQGGCRLGKGRGQILSREPTPEIPQRGFALVPPIGLSTAAVFRAFARSEPKAPEPRVGRNDLLEAALLVSKPFATIWHHLSDALSNELFFMTGSGSTLIWLSERETLPNALSSLLYELDVSASPFHFVDSMPAKISPEGLAP